MFAIAVLFMIIKPHHPSTSCFQRCKRVREKKKKFVKKIKFRYRSGSTVGRVIFLHVDWIQSLVCHRVL